MNLGFMQGRLSAPVEGRIQAFPEKEWRGEFPQAHALGLALMEWTLDHDGLSRNPLMTSGGRAEIRELCALHEVKIPSVTGDCFMQAPFWKCDTDGGDFGRLLSEFDAVTDACAAAGIGLIVVPLVDNGRIETVAHNTILHECLLARADVLWSAGVSIVFESDLPPAALAEWIAAFPEKAFGINYDTGNSASLGYDPGEEWRSYGHRIRNVHIKDRLRGGTTVPLGEGACDFAACAQAIRTANYAGNFILQTARAADGDHAAALARYRDVWRRAWGGEQRAGGKGNRA